jgi:hypothetical protein
MKWNESYFDELGNSAGVVGIIDARAEATAAAARAIAPVDSGDYRDSIKVSRRAAAHRQVAVVTADVPYGGIVEARDGTLNKALRMAAGG